MAKPRRKQNSGIVKRLSGKTRVTRLFVSTKTPLPAVGVRDIFPMEGHRWISHPALQNKQQTDAARFHGRLLREWFQHNRVTFAVCSRRVCGGACTSSAGTGISPDSLTSTITKDSCCQRESAMANAPWSSPRIPFPDDKRVYRDVFSGRILARGGPDQSRLTIAPWARSDAQSSSVCRSAEPRVSGVSGSPRRRTTLGPVCLVWARICGKSRSFVRTTYSCSLAKVQISASDAVGLPALDQ